MPSLMKKVQRKLRKLLSSSKKRNGDKSPSSVTTTTKVSHPTTPEPRRAEVTTCGNDVAATPVVPQSSPSLSSPAKPKESSNQSTTLVNIILSAPLEEAPTKVIPEIYQIDESVSSSLVLVHRQHAGETKEEVVETDDEREVSQAVLAQDNDDSIPVAATRRFPILICIIIVLAFTITIVVATSAVLVKEHHILPAAWNSTEPTKASFWNLIWPSNNLPIAMMEPSPAVPHDGSSPNAQEPIWNSMLTNPTAVETTPQIITEPPSLTKLIESSLEPYFHYLWQEEDILEPQESSYFTTVTKKVKSYWTTAVQQPRIESSLQTLEPYWTSMAEHYFQSASEYVRGRFQEEPVPPPKITVSALGPYLTAFGVGSISGLAWLALGSFWN